MHLVDDIHAIAPRLRRVFHLFAQIADLVHAVVAGRVDFQNIEAVFLRQRPAGAARAAGIAVLRVFAVDRAREHLRRRGFARAARAAEQIRMRDAPARDLAAQRFDHSLLPHKILEPRRTIAAIQRLIAHFVASTIQSIIKNRISQKEKLYNRSGRVYNKRRGQRPLSFHRMSAVFSFQRT